MTKEYKGVCYCTNLRRSANIVASFDKAMKNGG